MRRKRSKRSSDGQQAIPAAPPEPQPSASPVESGPASPPPPPPRQYRRRLANLRNVRSGLADVIRKLEVGELEVKLGNALVYAYGTLAGVMEAEKKLGEFEERIAALEAARGGAEPSVYVRRRGSGFTDAPAPGAPP